MSRFRRRFSIIYVSVLTQILLGLLLSSFPASSEASGNDNKDGNVQSKHVRNLRKNRESKLKVQSPPTQNANTTAQQDPSPPYSPDRTPTSTASSASLTSPQIKPENSYSSLQCAEFITDITVHTESSIRPNTANSENVINAETPATPPPSNRFQGAVTSIVRSYGYVDLPKKVKPNTKKNHSDSSSSKKTSPDSNLKSSSNTHSQSDEFNIIVPGQASLDEINPLLPTTDSTARTIPPEKRAANGEQRAANGERRQTGPGVKSTLPTAPPERRRFFRRTVDQSDEAIRVQAAIQELDEIEKIKNKNQLRTVFADLSMLLAVGSTSALFSWLDTKLLADHVFFQDLLNKLIWFSAFVMAYPYMQTLQAAYINKSFKLMKKVHKVWGVKDIESLGTSMTTSAKLEKLYHETNLKLTPVGQSSRSVSNNVIQLLINFLRAAIHFERIGDHQQAARVLAILIKQLNTLFAEFKLDDQLVLQHVWGFFSMSLQDKQSEFYQHEILRHLTLWVDREAIQEDPTLYHRYSSALKYWLNPTTFEVKEGNKEAAAAATEVTPAAVGNTVVQNLAVNASVNTGAVETLEPTTAAVTTTSSNLSQQASATAQIKDKESNEAASEEGNGKVIPNLPTDVLETLENHLPELLPVELMEEAEIIRDNEKNAPPAAGGVSSTSAELQQQQQYQKTPAVSASAEMMRP